LSAKLSSLLKPFINCDNIDDNWFYVLTPVISDIKNLGVSKVLKEQLQKEIIEETLVSFCLKWHSRYRDETDLKLVIDSTYSVKCFSVFKDIIHYFRNVISESNEEEIVGCLLKVLTLLTGLLEYHRLLIFDFLSTRTASKF